MTAPRALLVVNGDDFGLTPGVCHGILTAHERGIVTSTSVLAVGPAFPHWASALRDSGAGVGLHLCVVGEDPPLLSAREVPTLVDRRGRFPLTWQQFCRRAARAGVDQADIRRELTAQIEAVKGTGLHLDHLDAHQNLHLWPSVATVALELAERHRVAVLRVTGTRRWNLRSLGVRLLAGRLRHRARRDGLATADVAAGLDTAGRMDRATLVSVIRSFGAAGDAVDLTVHPGSDPDPDRERYRWGYRWGDELDALCAPSVRAAVDAAGFTLGTFADLAARASVER